MKKSELKKIILEALTPDEAAKVDSKYKEIYSGMLKNKPLKLKKYDNPDAVAYGRAIKLVQKESKLKEVYSEKQRRWACAQDDPKFDEMCKDTAISKKKKANEETSGEEIAKKNMDMYKDKNRLTELVKAALMGPMNENRYDINDPNSPLGKLNDEYESSGLKSIVDKYGLDVVLMMLSSGEYGDRLNESKKKQRPDYPDIDGDGDTKEPMVKALKDKEKSETNEDKVRGYFANLSEAILKELRG